MSVIESRVIPRADRCLLPVPFRPIDERADFSLEPEFPSELLSDGLPPDQTDPPAAAATSLSRTGTEVPPAQR